MEPDLESLLTKIDEQDRQIEFLGAVIGCAIALLEFHKIIPAGKHRSLVEFAAKGFCAAPDDAITHAVDEIEGWVGATTGRLSRGEA